MNNSIKDKLPSHHNIKLMNTYGVHVNIVDTMPNVLIKAKKVAEDYSAPILEIERQMKILFHHPYIYPEIVETYNKLEKKWKILTGYKENHRTPVLFEVKEYY